MSGNALDILSSIAGYTRAEGSGEAANRAPRLATVDPDYTDGSPKVTFDGEDTMSGKLYPYLDSYTPAPGDRVLLVPVGTTYLIVGAVSNGVESGIPAGAVQAFAGSSAPTGWLLCDGSAVSRSAYARLFAAIGTAWGVGDGSTTFNVPDLRGRVPVGAGAGAGLTSRALADEGGAEAHTATVAHTHTGPSHTHSLSGSAASGGASHHHAIEHNYTVVTVSLSGGGGYNVLCTTGTGATGYTTATHSHSLSGSTGSASGTTGSTGSASVDHMDPFAVVTYIIRV